MTRIALATCTDLPDWEVDDRPLHAAFAARGVQLDHPAWDDASFDWSSVDAVLVRTTWDYVARHAEFVAWAQGVETITRLFNPAAVIHWNTDKHYLVDLSDRGVPVAPTVWIPAGKHVGLAAVLHHREWDKAFLKPAVGSTAVNTLRFDAHTDLARAQAFLDETGRDQVMLLQPYLPSVEQEGELSVVRIDGRSTHAVRKVPVPGDYRVQDDFGASDEPIELTDELTALADLALGAVAQRLGLVEPLLYSRVDALRMPGGALVLNELELVEPSLFFRHGPAAAAALVHALLARLG